MDFFRYVGLSRDCGRSLVGRFSYVLVTFNVYGFLVWIFPDISISQETVVGRL